MNVVRMRRTIAAFLSLFCLIFCLASCRQQPEERETSAGALLADVARNYAGASSFTGTIGTQMHLTQDGKIVESSLNYDMEYVVSPSSLHLKGELTTNYEGDENTVEIESYSVPDGDEYLLYSRMSTKWTKESADVEQGTAVDNVLFSRLAELGDEGLTLEPDFADFNGQSVYVVKAVLTGEALSPFLNLVEDGGAAVEPSSLEQAAADVVLYVYADS